MAEGAASASSTEYEVPDLSIFHNATVYDHTGSPVAFSTLFEPSSTLVAVFIRHFNCGSCQTYVHALGSRISQESWRDANARVVIIGLGESKRIEAYKELTKCPFDIYSDPGRDLYAKLQLGSMSASDTSHDPKYHKRGLLGDTAAAVKNTFKMGSFTGGGNVGQLGADYVFRTGEPPSGIFVLRKVISQQGSPAPDRFLAPVKMHLGKLNAITPEKCQMLEATLSQRTYSMKLGKRLILWPAN